MRRVFSEHLQRRERGRDARGRGHDLRRNRRGRRRQNPDQTHDAVVRTV